MARIELSWTPHTQGIDFELVERGLLGKSRKLPIETWAHEAPEALLPGVGRLLAWVGEEQATRLEEAVRAPSSLIATLDGPSAENLRLPGPVPYLLDLGHAGTLDQPQFRFRLNWISPSHQPIPGLERIGALLGAGAHYYRVPQPLYDIIEHAEVFNRTPAEMIDERFLCWARLQEMLPEETLRSIRVDGYLAGTRIAHAARFSLTLQSGIDGFTFSPLLLGPSSSVEVEGDERDRGPESILPPAQQRVFSEQRFPSVDHCRARYPLGEGWYVVIDEALRVALTVVRRAQLADRDTRRAFARNPRAFVREALGDQLDETVIDSLFVETAEYSRRVLDVGLWTPKVLPWIRKTEFPWLPERIGGLLIDNAYVDLKTEDIPKLTSDIKAAINRGEPFVEFDGQRIPATEQALRSLEALEGIMRPSSSAETSSDEAEEPKETPAPIVLQISDNLDEIGFAASLRARTRELAFSRVSERVRTKLLPHQHDGVQWLQATWIAGLPGVLLADDMGLGKTLQALAFLTWLQDLGQQAGRVPRPILIVAPTGLLKNWEQEHERHLHAPGLGEPLRAYGAELRRLRRSSGDEITAGESLIDTTRLIESKWVLTTYESLRDYQLSFGAVRFRAAVFDEVQKIKTPSALVTHAAKAMNADFVVAMTGTPIENRLADLWCIIDRSFPGRLLDLATFSKTYEREDRPDDLRRLKKQLTGAHDGAPAIMLRRLKLDYLEGLPAKHEHLLEETMPREQARAYDSAIAAARARRGQGTMLKALQDLRGISLHPIHPAQAKDVAYLDLSARLKRTFETLDRIAVAGEKALLFLEHLDMQRYLATVIQRRYGLSEPPMLINGMVSGAVRQKRVDAFQSRMHGFDVIVLSPRAGGVGLTLTAANHVIHLSRWWNPAVEDQCTDRVYRIGQTREVHIYYPLALHPSYPEQSFDRRLHELLARKRALSREMLAPPVDPERDARVLFEETIGPAAPRIDLATIDAMEPVEFESWVLDRLREHSYQVDRTPRTHDAGADGIARPLQGGKTLIVQCKHTQQQTPLPETAVNDLLRAREAYGIPDARLVVVTNSGSFSASAQQKAAANDVRLVGRDALTSWPYSVPNLQ